MLAVTFGVGAAIMVLIVLAQMRHDDRHLH